MEELNKLSAKTKKLGVTLFSPQNNKHHHNNNHSNSNHPNNGHPHKKGAASIVNEKSILFNLFPSEKY